MHIARGWVACHVWVVGRLLSQIGKNLKNKHPNQFVKLRIELLRDDRNFDSDAIKRRAIQSYERTENLDSGDFRITIEVEQLDSFGKTFEAELKREDVIPSLFESVRSRRGDYGYFARFEDELVFLNLVPIRESRQAKNMFKLISDTCDRQFTKGRPAFLWLHLQALDAAELKPPFEPLPFVERLARHAFKSEQRTHVASLIVSGDTNVEGKSYPLRGRNVRGMESIGYVKGFDNPRCHFDPGPVFAPLFEQ